jgi:hypothetical protein
MLFILLNVLFAGCLAAALYLFIIVLGGTDPLALFGVLYLSLAFVAVGVLLHLIYGKLASVALNKNLPFAAAASLTVAALLNVTTFSLWLGIVMSAVILVASGFTTFNAVNSRAD